MPDLFQTLRTTDLDFIQRLARSWKLDLETREFSSARDEFISLVKDRDLFDENIAALPERASAAWEYLIGYKGQESWAMFTRLSICVTEKSRRLPFKAITILFQ